MQKREKAKNEVILIGKVTDLHVEYEFQNTKFYSFYVETERTSGTIDKIPVYTNETFCEGIKNDDRVKITGEYRSRNQMIDGKSRLILRVYCRKKIEKIGMIDNLDIDLITISGVICRQPVFRTTPLTEKNITDVMIASNRNYTADYIPLIFWNKYAFKAKDFKVGEKIEVIGRIQSRSYTNSKSEFKTAYEISVRDYALLGGTNGENTK